MYRLGIAFWKNLGRDWIRYCYAKAIYRLPKRGFGLKFSGNLAEIVR